MFIIIYYCFVDVDGFNVFYCEVGCLGVLKLLLLYGFLSFSYMFCDLILLLVDCFYIVVLDLLGFG